MSEPQEIWAKIVKADELLKYATTERSEARREQARRLYEEALAEAEAIGNDALATQASRRLTDLSGAS